MVEKIACAVLDGGLGNQLFQYACAFAIAKEHGRSIRFLTDSVKARGDHGALMINQVFDIPFLGLDQEAFGLLTRCALGHRQKSLMNRFNSLRMAFPAGVFDGGEQNAVAQKMSVDTLFCAGYHQDESVFIKHSPELFKNLVYRGWLEEHYLRASARLAGMLVLHMRLGDYVDSDKNKRIYSQLDANYYKSALSDLSEGVGGGAEILLVSDDVPKAKQRLGALGKVWTTKDLGLESDAVRDFVSMSAASRLVIANSTYSWWAGRIAEAKASAVIRGPSSWYVDRRKPNPVPFRWLA